MNYDNLIVDLSNLFIRSWAAYPQMSTVSGQQMGGIVGTLKTIKRLVTNYKPKKIFIIWESGGSFRRRKIYSEYKLGRRPEKVNRFYGEDIPESVENQKHQLMVLVSILNLTPFTQIFVEDAEADDVIAQLCCQTLKNENNLIISSDKDLYQLMSDTVHQYSLHKKEIVQQEDVFEEFRITAQNFAIAKSICGDKSDNIPGIKGVGFKTISKLFPTLGTQDSVLLSDIKSYCYTHENLSKIYKRIIDEWSTIERNWKLIYLNGSILSMDQINKINYSNNTNGPQFNKIEIYKILNREGIDFDISDFIVNLRYLNK